MSHLMKLSALMLGAVLLVAACDDNGDSDATETPDSSTVTATATVSEPDETPTDEPTDTPTSTATADGTGTPAADAIEITGVDYAFEGVPDTAEPGTSFTFRNDSDVEVHEMILFHIPEGEDRSIDELLALPEEEANSIVGQPVGVAVALPGEEGQVVEGELTVEEPGRYVMLCFIPVGADPDVVATAMAGGGGDGPPDMGDGPPHYVEGMVAEFTVE